MVYGLEWLLLCQQSDSWFSSPGGPQLSVLTQVFLKQSTVRLVWAPVCSIWHILFTGRKNSGASWLLPSRVEQSLSISLIFTRCWSLRAQACVKRTRRMVLIWWYRLWYIWRGTNGFQNEHSASQGWELNIKGKGGQERAQIAFLSVFDLPRTPRQPCLQRSDLLLKLNFLSM